MEVLYKKVDPNSKKELEALFKLYDNLNMFLYAPPISFETRYWTEVKIKDNKENYYICYINGEPVGFVGMQNYHLVKTEAIEDHIGVISEIYVLPKFQKEDYAYQLLQKGIETLIEIAKRKMGKRSDGTIPYDYELLITDLNKIKKMTKKEIGYKAVKIRRKTREEKTEEDISHLLS